MTRRVKHTRILLRLIGNDCSTMLLAVQPSSWLGAILSSGKMRGKQRSAACAAPTGPAAWRTYMVCVGGGMAEAPVGPLLGFCIWYCAQQAGSRVKRQLNHAQ